MVAKRDKDGYKYLGLYQNGVRKWKRVHCLVAETFIPNDKNLPMINHKDGIRDNNVVSNLEWCDNSYNQSYSYHVMGRKGNCINRKPIRLIHKDTLEYKDFSSLTDCANHLNMNLSYLSGLLLGKQDIKKCRRLKHYNIQML